MMKKKYFANWESLNSHPIPQWYEDCKLGIFIHWGLYSVPAFANPSYQLGEIPTEYDWYVNNPYAEWYENSVRVGEVPPMNTTSKHMEKILHILILQTCGKLKIGIRRNG